MELGTQVTKPLTRATIEKILHSWCDRNGVHWEDSYLLDRAVWNSHRRAQHARGIDLPPAQWVVYLADAGLYDVVNQTDARNGQYKDLLAWLRKHDLTLSRFLPHYAGVIRLRRKGSA
jgi:hypothetical protein